MANFQFKRFLNLALLMASTSLLPACALLQGPASEPAPVVAKTVIIEEDTPVAVVAAPAPASATVATATVPPAPSRYMQFVKEKKPLFEMDMKTGPACQNMATTFGRTPVSERNSSAVRCNPKSVSAVLPVSAVMKNPKTQNNFVARFRSKEFCTRVLDTLAQNGKSTVVRECADRKKA
jgi:hypothetical protein